MNEVIVEPNIVKPLLVSVVKIFKHKEGVASLGPRISSSAIPSNVEYEGFLWRPEYLSKVYSSLIEG